MIELMSASLLLLENREKDRIWDFVFIIILYLISSCAVGEHNIIHYSLRAVFRLLVLLVGAIIGSMVTKASIVIITGTGIVFDTERSFAPNR